MADTTVDVEGRPMLDKPMVRVVKIFAQPYAGRDGWREEWTL